jgi:hypothetical protein
MGFTPQCSKWRPNRPTIDALHPGRCNITQHRTNTMEVTLENTTYAIYYGNGGYGGPYNVLDDAIRDACKILRRSNPTISIWIIDRRRRGTSSLYAILKMRPDHNDPGRIDISQKPDLRALCSCSCGDIVEHDGEKFIVASFYEMVNTNESQARDVVRLSDGHPMSIGGFTTVLRKSIGRARQRP